ncbi:hypothetical protein EJ08DRAFT_651300 [Tothia fuscella]|uniref:Uncharacterized protein n=1 Tax=Tothia fuscella TaxID=1048955 RepID=A0A9P4NMW3_9PEZI|nr:hypothetical protein EJ08DRAFT_651300 [Tothia fuscella]
MASPHPFCDGFQTFIYILLILPQSLLSIAAHQVSEDVEKVTLTINGFPATPLHEKRVSRSVSFTTSIYRYQ